MKKIFYLIGLWLVFASCENELPYQREERGNVLVMNALMECGTTENRVYLNLSGTETTSDIYQGRVSLYVNGEIKETSKAEYKDSWDYTLRQMSCGLHTELHPGDKIRLEASANEGAYHAYAEVCVPYPIDPIEQVDTLTTKRWNGYSEQNVIQYRIPIKDRPGERNYYRLVIESDEYMGWEKKEIDNRDELVLSEGHSALQDDDDYNVFSQEVENIYQLFSDTRFEDSHYTLKVYTSYRTPDDYWYDWDKHLYAHARIHLISLTEEMYRYLRALTLIQSDSYNELLMEPVIIPCNVVGGRGFVGVSADRSFELQIMDRPQRR